MTAPGTPPPARPDWYPDPSGRYELRYHNGVRWTADVATDGQRFVDSGGGAVGLTPPGRTSAGTGDGGTGDGGTPGNGIAIAGLTCGILSVAFGWLPVVFAAGAVLAVLGLVFGTVGLRRSRRTASGRGFAIAALVTGAVGVLVAVGGLMFTIAVFRAIDRYENPAAHTVTITECAVADDTITVAGALRNDGEAAADFTVRVEVRREGSGRRVTTVRDQLDRVPAGATVEWRASRPARVDAVECAPPDVSGPLPFGVDLG